MMIIIFIFMCKM